MKLAPILEAGYGTGLSQQDRENMIRDIYDMIPGQDDIRRKPTIYTDDWRVVITFDNVDYYEVRERLVAKYGESTNVDGYEEGRYNRNIPSWKVKDHQIRYTSGYGDVDIEISKYET